MTGLVAGVLWARDLRKEKRKSWQRETRSCAGDTCVCVCVLSSLTVRSSNDYPMWQRGIVLLIYTCSHLMFLMISPRRGSRASATPPTWARAVPWSELELWSLCPVPFKTLPHRVNPGLKSQTILGALLQKNSYLYTYYKNMLPFDTSRAPPKTSRSSRACAGLWIPSLLSSKVPVPPARSQLSRCPSQPQPLPWGLHYLKCVASCFDWVLWETFWYQVSICFHKIIVTPGRLPY